MSKIGFITAGITAALFIGVMFIVAPGIMRQNTGILLLMVPVIAVLIAIGAIIGRAVLKKYDAAFREALAGLGLEYGSFYNIRYAYGKYRGLHVSFKYSRIAKHDLAPPLPGESSMVILCRVKLPGTGNRKLHLAVFPEDRTQALRGMLGWINPEPGVYLARVKGQSEEDARAVFGLISRGTMEKMRRIAERSGSCAVSTDWETVMIGRDNALKLLAGDEQALSQLDFQIKIPIRTSREALAPFLEEMMDAADSLSNNLRR